MFPATANPLEAEKQNELRAMLYAQRVELARVHDALDKLAIPRRDKFGESYDLPARLERIKIDLAECDAIAQQARLDYLTTAARLRESERRRVKLEHALSVMRHINTVLDFLTAVRRAFARTRIVRTDGEPHP